MNPKFTNQGPGDPSLNPQAPIYGLLQADFVYQENVDGVGGFPLNLDYFIPVNCQRVITARLSFRRRAYRTYSNFSAVSTNLETTDHFHAVGAETGHTHNHAHTIPIDAGPFTNATGRSAAGGHFQDAFGPDTAPTNANAAGSSGHNHGNTGGRTAAHLHTLSVSSTLGVVEGAVATSITVAFDGVDQTANLIPAGPYSTDQVEIDVTKFISTVVDRAWHVVSLQPSALGRIQAVLRILYNSNQV